MSHLDPFGQLLETIQAEWNRAEEDIKIAELVCNKIVIPAIKELRYAGRRTIDALNCIQRGGTADEVKTLFEEARFDCHRARHDAIDAATAKIASDLDIMVKKLGHHAIITAFPEFAKLWMSLRRVRDQIAKSRGNRTDRETIYSVIETTNFPNLVDLYNDMRAREQIMIDLAAQDKNAASMGLWGIIIGIAGGALGVIAIILSVYLWRYAYPDWCEIHRSDFIGERVCEPIKKEPPKTE